jgi:hypothetical protein
LSITALNRLALATACALALPALASAQAPAKAPAPAPLPAVKDATPAFTLKVTQQRVATFTSKDAHAADVAESLTKELRIPVRMSPLVAKQRVTLKLTGVPIENLLLALAPQVYVDFEVRWDQPQEDWVGVELTGLNEHEPNTPVEQKAFIVLAGNTDDESVTAESLAKDQADADEAKLNKDPPKEGPVLDVSVKDGLVSIRARKQTVTAILLDVASKAGLGFETRGDLDETIVDLDIRSTPVEQIPAAVARPGVALLMRRNVTTGGTRAVAMLLGSEASRLRKAPVK